MKKHARQGSTAIEFALTLPILVVILAGVLEYGWYLFQLSNVVHALRDGGKEVEFWLKRHYAREQDSEVVGLDHGNPENHELYGRLQQQLREEVKTVVITTINVN